MIETNRYHLYRPQLNHYFNTVVKRLVKISRLSSHVHVHITFNFVKMMKYSMPAMRKERTQDVTCPCTCLSDLDEYLLISSLTLRSDLISLLDGLISAETIIRWIGWRKIFFFPLYICENRSGSSYIFFNFDVEGVFLLFFYYVKLIFDE